MKQDGFTPKPTLTPGKYCHYSGKEYEVVDVVCDSETLEWRVLYRRLYESDGPELWVRPYKMFIEEVVVDGQKMPRFQFIDNQR